MQELQLLCSWHCTYKRQAIQPENILSFMSDFDYEKHRYDHRPYVGHDDGQTEVKKDK